MKPKKPCSHYDCLLCGETSPEPKMLSRFLFGADVWFDKSCWRFWLSGMRNER